MIRSRCRPAWWKPADCVEVHCPGQISRQAADQPGEFLPHLRRAMAAGRSDEPGREQIFGVPVIVRYFGRDARTRIIVDDPATAIDVTVLEGFVYLDGAVPTIIHDRSGRPDVYPWALLAGPVLRIYELAPRRKPLVVYAHPGWRPRHRQ